MRILITGIAGLIGSRFAQWLTTHTDAQVLGIDDLSTGFRANIPPDCDFALASLGEQTDQVARVFHDFRPHLVYHFAAFAAEVLSPFVRSHTVRNTWGATAEVITHSIANRVQRLVFTSSIAVYGHQRPPFDEGHPMQPADPYGVGKTACEQDLRIAGDQHGLDWCILRPHNVYGASQNIWVDDRNVFGIWMRQALQGGPLRIYGDGMQTRAFSAIEDVLPCLWTAGTSPAASRQVINVGGTRPRRIIDAAMMLSNLAGGVEIEHVPARHEAQESWATWGKSVELLGYQDLTPLQDGLARMWKWARHAWHQYPERRDPPPIPLELYRSA